LWITNCVIPKVPKASFRRKFIPFVTEFINIYILFYYLKFRKVLTELTENLYSNRCDIMTYTVSDSLFMTVNTSTIR
jgi:hypothetical protein